MRPVSGSRLHGNVVATLLDTHSNVAVTLLRRSRGDSRMSRDAVVGIRIAALREQAGLKQNELAKKLAWSAAVLSRVESGDRALSDDEVGIVLSGIGTPDALKLQELLKADLVTEKIRSVQDAVDYLTRHSKKN